jgi:hypothetical protein
MKRFSLHALLSLFLALSFAACDSADDGDGDGNGGGNVDSGEFAVDFGGGLDGSFEGNAYFAVVEDDDYPGGRAFVLFMTDSDLTSGQTQSTQYIAFVRIGDRPGTGTYNLADAQGEDPTDTEGVTYGIYINSSGQTSGTFLASQSGTLTISESSSDEVSGSFDFEGIGFDSSNPNEQIMATLSGSFSANAISDDIIIVPDTP